MDFPFFNEDNNYTENKQIQVQKKNEYKAPTTSIQQKNPIPLVGSGFQEVNKTDIKKQTTPFHISEEKLKKFINLKL